MILCHMVLAYEFVVWQKKKTLWRNFLPNETIVFFFYNIQIKVGSF